MEWEFIVMLALAVPVILFPVAFVAYLNLNGTLAAAGKRGARLLRAKDLRERANVPLQPEQGTSGPTDKAGKAAL
jgi:hypothetical protein